MIVSKNPDHTDNPEMVPRLMTGPILPKKVAKNGRVIAPWRVAEGQLGEGDMLRSRPCLQAASKTKIWPNALI